MFHRNVVTFMSVVFGALYDVLKSNKALVGLTNRLHTTVIELRLKWNGHQFVAVTNISFSICSRGRR